VKSQGEACASLTKGDFFIVECARIEELITKK